MNKHIIILFFLFTSGVLDAQEFLIHQYPKLDTLPKKIGANRENYYAGLGGFGFFGGPTDSSASDVSILRSAYWTIGGRYKHKRNNVFSSGIDWYITYRQYRILQTNQKTFGGQVKHQRERYSQLTLDVSYFWRFNLNKRGNHLGKYIDLFTTGIFSPMNRYVVHDKIDPLYGTKEGKYVFSKLQYARWFYYNVGMRYGISFFQFVATYRLGNMFKRTNQYPYAELPRFSLGILIDIESE